MATTKKLFGTVGLMFTGLLAVAAAAKADVHVTNGTDRDLRFSMQCGTAEPTNWKLDAHGNGALYCSNGARTVVIRVLTNRDNGSTATITQRVIDGRTYMLRYNESGDVDIVTADAGEGRSRPTADRDPAPRAPGGGDDDRATPAPAAAAPGGKFGDRRTSGQTDTLGKL